MKKQTEFQEKARAAAVRFAAARGMRVLDDGFEGGYLVLMDGDVLAFAEVRVTEKGKRFAAEPEGEKRDKVRRRFEDAACRWLERNGAPLCEVRFDSISLRLLAGDRAMVRYHKGAYSGC